MYRNVAAVLTALQTSKTTVRSCRNQLSINRKKGDIASSLMYLIAIELFKSYPEEGNTPERYLLL